MMTSSELEKLVASTGDTSVLAGLSKPVERGTELAHGDELGVHP